MDVEEFLEHHGIKGQKWGVINKGLPVGGDKAPGVSSSTNRAAKKHAEEFARAKMFYGEGAGTRRKLINNTVEANKKKDPAYAKAFDYHLAKQDLAQHASKAKTERGRIDKTKTVKKTTSAVARRVTGEWGTAAAYTAVLFAGAAFLKSPKGQAMVRRYVHRVDVRTRSRKTEAFVSDFFKRNG